MSVTDGSKKIGSSVNRFPVLWLLVVVAAALLLRANALWVPHWRGDQVQYTILAMKLTNFGLDGYNLRRVVMGMSESNVAKDRNIVFAALKPDPDPKAKGMYIQMMENIGQGYYDEPLHMRAPLFPALLAGSHHFLGGARGSFFVLTRGFKWGDPIWKTRKVWMMQFWVVAVPLFFNLALIALTGILAWLIFGERRTAVYAAVLLATNPLSIFLAHRTMTEDTATFWLTAAMTALWCWRFRSKGKVSWIATAAAGICAGAAVLTNQRLLIGVMAIVGIAVIWLWQDGGYKEQSSNKNAWCIKRVMGLVQNSFFWIFAAALIAVTIFWFIRVIRVYGEPLHQPNAGLVKANQEDITGWFAAVAARPHTSLLFALGVPMMCPLFAAAYLSWKRFWSAINQTLNDVPSRGTILLWIWILAFYIYLAYPQNIFEVGNKEQRYFYFTYPAIAILAASVLPRVRQWAIPILILNAAWGCWYAYPKIFADQMLF